jgi:peptidoglycan/LPS O-acetylase OafA/YrhL
MMPSTTILAPPAPAMPVQLPAGARAVASAAGAPERSGAQWLGTLDSLRGLAAFYVMCTHARTLLMLSLKDSAHLGLSARLAVTVFSAALTFGHQAVIVFFALSGFCIHYRQASTLHKAQAGGKPFAFAVGGYLYRRVRRIAPPFYYALALTALLNWVARAINPELFVRFTPNPFVNHLLAQSLDLKTLLGNLVFVQSLYVPTFGNNGPLWSLAYEFYFYLMYPLYLLLRRRTGPWQSLAAVALLSAVAGVIKFRLANAYWAGFIPVITYWCSWVLGATVAELYVGAIRLPRWVASRWLTLILVGLWLANVRNERFQLPSELQDCFGALACSQGLLALLGLKGAAHPQSLVARWTALTRWLGSFSYTLYLVHLPVLAVVASIWLLAHPALPLNPMLFVAGMLISVGVAWLSYLLVEKHFAR